jgi:hypothetical protein
MSGGVGAPRLTKLINVRRFPSFLLFLSGKKFGELHRQFPEVLWRDLSQRVVRCYATRILEVTELFSFQFVLIKFGGNDERRFPCSKGERPVSANGRGRHIKLVATGIAWRCQVHAKTLATTGRAAGGPARDKHTPLSYRLIGAHPGTSGFHPQKGSGARICLPSCISRSER